MKNLILALSFVFVFSIGGMPCLHAEPKKSESAADRESIGKLRLGMSAAAVERALGKAESKGKNEEMDATGEWVQDWNFPAQGITLHMASGRRDGAKTVSNIVATGKCALATSRGIKIGSTEAEVKKAYAGEQNKEESRAGETFVAGSIYGGVMFDFKKGKVSQIFIGAAAE